MKRKTLALLTATLIAIVAIPTVFFVQKLHSVVPSEPTSLQDIVEFPGTATHMDLEEPERTIELNRIMTTVEGFFDIMFALQAKGHLIDEAVIYDQAIISRVHGEVPGDPSPTTFSGVMMSCWSEGEGPKGTKALIAAALIDDGENIVFGADTNVLSPEHIPGVDPYIIVNAMPYFYIEWYWWCRPYFRIVHWKYWWHDSHNHRYWFWGPYWWWRVYLSDYVVPWVPWYWYWWSWIYHRHWYFWSCRYPWLP